MNVALIVFAGKGVRMNSPLPKQFIKIKDKELVAYTIEKFQNHPLIDEVVLVTSIEYVEYTKKMCETYGFSKVKHIVKGGNTRQESVKLGLLASSYDDQDIVLIHDGDRPLVSEKIISNCINSMNDNVASTVMIKHRDSLKDVSNLGRCKVVDKEEIDIQTPQTFRYGLISKAHIMKEKELYSDDISLIEDFYKVKYLEGDPYNFKVTTDIDLKKFESIISL